MSEQQIMKNLHLNDTETLIDYNSVITNKPCYLIITEKIKFQENDSEPSSSQSVHCILPALEDGQAESDVKYYIVINNIQLIGHFEYRTNRYVFVCESSASISPCNEISAYPMTYDGETESTIDFTFDEVDTYNIAVSIVEIATKPLNNLLLPDELKPVWNGNKQVSIRDAIIALSAGVYSSLPSEEGSGGGNGGC